MLVQVNYQGVFRTLFVMLGFFLLHEALAMRLCGDDMHCASPGGRQRVLTSSPCMAIEQASCIVPVYAIRDQGAIDVAHVLADVSPTLGPCIRPTGGRPSPLMIGGEYCFGLPAIETTDDGFSPTQILARLGMDGQWLIISPTSQERRKLECKTQCDTDTSQVQQSEESELVESLLASPLQSDASNGYVEAQSKTSMEHMPWLMLCPLCWQKTDKLVRFTPSCRFCMTCHRCAAQRSERGCSLCPRYCQASSHSAQKLDDIDSPRSAQQSTLFRPVVVELCKEGPRTPSPLAHFLLSACGSTLSSRCWSCEDD